MKQSIIESSHRSILKQNKYKLVELIQKANGSGYVIKTFRGHPEHFLRKNAHHTFQSLSFLRTAFGNCVWSPMPLAWNPEKFTVQMEYIPELVGARSLSLKEAKRTFPFFERCYQINVPIDFLPSIMNSVLLTNAVRNLMEKGFPLCLGFKGDLYENLLLSKDSLIIADVETMCVEPLGLSELVLYCNFYASSEFFQILRIFLSTPIIPIVSRFLAPQQLREINKVAIDFFARNYLKNIPRPIRHMKMAMIVFLFYLSQQRYFKKKSKL